MEPFDFNSSQSSSKTSSSTQYNPVCVLNPKQDLHVLGYDPFKHVPEFREKKRSSLLGSRELRHRNPLSMKEGSIAPGFGIGSLEELDIEDEDLRHLGLPEIRSHKANCMTWRSL
ncbi:hypothetical protein F0562_023545 [Nyssa sinensis]|uniref:Uncharacterized protein n=1 Tax=Nyssa sinensis TaxID=561372 RepID=A0A5J5BHU9_9ASTE|nr:hypothetical protein F0562_023545 [Nyssa sinensis]